MKFGHLNDLNLVDFSLPNINEFTKEMIRQSANPTNEINVYLGAPVWSDKHYLGTLYPKGTKQKDFLFEYAKQFNSIEVNATIANSKKVIAKWMNAVREDFKFSLKFLQVITYEKISTMIKQNYAWISSFPNRSIRDYPE